MSQVMMSMDKYNETRIELNDEELAGVAGGINVKELPEFEKIRTIYKEKGIRTASALASHYYGDDVAVEIMRTLSKE